MVISASPFPAVENQMMSDISFHPRFGFLAACLAFGSTTFAQATDSTIPRTADGKPNFQGFWSSTAVTPLERPAALGDKAFYTPEEFAEFEKAQLEVEETESGTAEDVHYGFVDYGLHPSQSTRAVNLRTSIVYDPPDGRIPAMTPAATAIMEARRVHALEHATDSARERPLQERCIVWPHNGPPMLPTGYNNNNKIIQTSGHFVFQPEMMQDPRIIPLDGRAPIPQGIPQWYGSSRGHWEGDTIVVETTNFTGLTGRGLPSITSNGRVTERFTLVAPDTLLYQFTVNDPATWTAPWSGEFHMQRTTGPMFEYACHEGNYGIVDVLSSARANEQTATGN
jgi:hypothetical protein